MDKGFKQFITKSVIFIFLFVFISVIIGQKIVSSSLLYGFKIFIYGGWGYISLFSILGFILLYRERLLKLKVYSFSKGNIFVFEGFSAKIGEASSGIYSIFIFISLYLFAVILDWKKLNKTKAGLIFIPAIIGAFFVNILRVFLLFIFGAFVSHDLALGLYHSYTGMIFFLIYFAVFWSLSYNWMKKV